MSSQASKTTSSCHLKDDARATKNAKIAKTYRETKERRKTQTPDVVDLKIQTNKLSATQKESLIRVFLEAKWLYNAAVGSDDVFSYEIPKHTVPVVLPKETEQREFRVLGSQMKQSVVTGVKNSIRGLAKLKKNGKKVGKLRFTSKYTSIDLKQAGTTHKIRGSKVKVQNIPGWLRVRGVHRIGDGELANAKLVQRQDGYHVLVTVYRPKRTTTPPVEGALGIDFGVKTALTLSTGEKINYRVGESERLKRLQRKRARQGKGSNNYRKTQSLIRREYAKTSNRRDDYANKLVHNLKQCEYIFIQDENLSGWRTQKSRARGGRKIQHGILGRVKAKLTKLPQTTMLDRYVPTTATCSACGKTTRHDVDKRLFVCSHCGHSADRDVHAAKNMIILGGHQGKLIPPGQREFKPVKNPFSTAVGADVPNGCTADSLTQEAPLSSAAR